MRCYLQLRWYFFVFFHLLISLLCADVFRSAPAAVCCQRYHFAASIWPIWDLFAKCSMYLFVCIYHLWIFVCIYHLDIRDNVCCKHSHSAASSWPTLTKIFAMRSLKTMMVMIMTPKIMKTATIMTNTMVMIIIEIAYFCNMKRCPHCWKTPSLKSFSSSTCWRKNF